MPSGADLVNEVIDTLRSNNENQLTTLNNAMLATDLSFTVQATQGIAQAISPGAVEIDSELIYVTAIAADGTCTVAPWGRGYRGTTAATHAINSKVISNPYYPRFRVLRALNEAINRVFPTLFAVKTTNFTTNAISFTYDLPEDAQWPLNVKWQPVSAAQNWVKVRRWSYDTGHGSADALGVSLDIGDRMQGGRPLVVTYAAQPGNITEASDFATVTGLDSDHADVIVLGAAASLAPPLEFARELINSVEQQERNQLISPAAALASGSYLEKQFQARLKEAGRSLQLKYGPRIVGVF